MTFEERVSWIINYIKKEHSLNNISLGKVLDSNKNTIQSYSKGKGDFKGNVLAGIVKNYGINGEWIMSGKGEPFPRAGARYPEICGPPGLTTDQQHQITESVHAQMNYSPDALFKSDQKLNIEEAMGKAYKVLNAGTSLSVALYMNIQQFAVALDTGQALQLCMEQAKEFQNQINEQKMDYENKFIEQENTFLNKISELNRKIDRLSASSSIAEGQGDGSAKVNERA